MSAPTTPTAGSSPATSIYSASPGIRSVKTLDAEKINDDIIITARSSINLVLGLIPRDLKGLVPAKNASNIIEMSRKALEFEVERVREDGSKSMLKLQESFATMSPAYFANEKTCVLKSVVRKDVLQDDVFGVYYPELHKHFVVTIMGTNSALNYWTIPAEQAEVIPLLQAIEIAAYKMKDSTPGFPAIQPM